MESHTRRGIYRPKAQRLNITLAPLVAQRSLLFRIQTDLAHKASYAELSPLESPGLFTAASSAQLISAVLSGAKSGRSCRNHARHAPSPSTSIMSSASVYSQDTLYDSEVSSPVFPAPERRKTPKCAPGHQKRRHAMIFSPSIQIDTLGCSDDSDTSASGFDSCVAITPLSVNGAVKADTDSSGINPMHTVDIDFYLQRKLEVANCTEDGAGTLRKMKHKSLAPRLSTVPGKDLVKIVSRFSISRKNRIGEADAPSITVPPRTNRLMRHIRPNSTPVLPPSRPADIVYKKVERPRILPATPGSGANDTSSKVASLPASKPQTKRRLSSPPPYASFSKARRRHTSSPVPSKVRREWEAGSRHTLPPVPCLPSVFTSSDGGQSPGHVRSVSA